MPNDALNEREFELVNIVGANLGADQRRLSRLMDLSLGMTNMLIRRMIAKGYIRIRQLNKRKVEYILTPKGFTEKMRKSVKYTLKTINSIGLIKNRVKELAHDLYDRGERNFYILGGSDLVTLVEMALKDLPVNDYRIFHLKEIPIGKIDGTIIICQEIINRRQLNGHKTIDLLQELGKSHDIIAQQPERGAYVK